MKIGNNKMLWLGAFFVFLFDQGTKIWSLNYLEFDTEIIINKYLSFHRIYNEGTVMLDYTFSFISIDTFRLLWLMTAITLSVGIYWVINQKSMRESGWNGEFSKVGLFLILGSIWGNAYDRIFRTEGVIDFIRLNMFTDSVPIMNIADIMLFVGEFCLILGWLFILYQKISINKKSCVNN